MSRAFNLSERRLTDRDEFALDEILADLNGVCELDQLDS